MHNPKRLIGFALIGVGAIDLLFGNTSTPILPEVVANHLTQQTDMILIGLGVLLVFYL